jgi:hypothetical protein
MEVQGLTKLVWKLTILKGLDETGKGTFSGTVLPLAFRILVIDQS